MTDALEDGHAVDAGHDEVEDHQRDRVALLGFENLEGLLARAAGLGFKTETLDRLFENATLGGIVINDQNTLGHGARNFTITDTGCRLPLAPNWDLTQLLTFGDRQITQQGRQ